VDPETAWSSSNVLTGFGLTALAGLSTGIGSLIALFQRRTNPVALGAALGFSAGVMVYLAFVELLAEAFSILETTHGPSFRWVAIGGFFAGIGLIAGIDALVPSYDNPHDVIPSDDFAQREAPRLRRLGVLTALAIGIHNFPEGIASFFSAVASPPHGVFVAIAVGLHNIPEGIAVSAPIFYATGSRTKAFTWSFLSGLAEPIGAVLAWLLLRRWTPEAILGPVLAGVAGIMVFIALDQLIPNAKRYATGHAAVYGLVAGMAVMAVSVELLR
jgi:ZIP family zinc transporter